MCEYIQYTQSLVPNVDDFILYIYTDQSMNHIEYESYTCNIGLHVW